MTGLLFGTTRLWRLEWAHSRQGAREPEALDCQIDRMILGSTAASSTTVTNHSGHGILGQARAHLSFSRTCIAFRIRAKLSRNALPRWWPLAGDGGENPFSQPRHNDWTMLSCARWDNGESSERSCWCGEQIVDVVKDELRSEKQ